MSEQLHNINILSTTTVIGTETYKLISVDKLQELLDKIALLEKEKNNIEIKKNIIETQYNELSLSVQKYIATIQQLREDKIILQQTIDELNQRITELETTNQALNGRIYNLENTNQTLNNRIFALENERTEKNKMLKRSECIYNYKKSIKNHIFNNNVDYDVKQWDLFDILFGKYDENMEDDEKNRRDIFISSINSKYKSNNVNPKRIVKNSGLKVFQRYLKDITDIRIPVAHPNIPKTEYVELKQDFLDYCNTKWSDDYSINATFTDDIFSVLINS